MAATVVCVRTIELERMIAIMEHWDVSHFGGAPVVPNMLANSPNAPARINPDRTDYCMTAGAPPPATELARIGAWAAR